MHLILDLEPSSIPHSETVTIESEPVPADGAIAAIVLKPAGDPMVFIESIRARGPNGNSVAMSVGSFPVDVLALANPAIGDIRWGRVRKGDAICLTIRNDAGHPVQIRGHVKLRADEGCDRRSDRRSDEVQILVDREFESWE